MTPLVSILIPCRNAAPWLSQCLDSAFAQTWRNKEVILVDDGSTDSSLAIAASYQKHGLQLISGPQKNASAARNTALRQSSGDWIQFLDADDVLAINKIQFQMEEAIRHPHARLFSGQWARFQKDPLEAVFPEQANYRDMSGVEFLQIFFETHAMMQPAAWLSRRDLLEESGSWNETLTLNDDGEYFARVMLTAGVIIHCSRSRIYYRTHTGGNLGSRRDPASLDSAFRAIELTIQHLAAADDTPRTRAALAYAWKWLAFELYPEASQLSRTAWQQSLKLGGSKRDFPAGPTFQSLSKLFGWRLSKLLRNRFFST